jgi:hypothetical protein
VNVGVSDHVYLKFRSVEYCMVLFLRLAINLLVILVYLQRGSIVESFRFCYVIEPPIQLVLGVKWSGCEADLPPPSSAEARNDGAISLLPRMSSWCRAYLIKWTLPFSYIIERRYVLDCSAVKKIAIVCDRDVKRW